MGRVRSKDEIAASGLSETKAKYGDLEPRKIQNRRALVIGSNSDRNIGAYIARNLRDDFILTDEVDKPDLDICNPVEVDNFDWEPYDTVVVASGYTNLEWVEKQEYIEIHEMVYTNLIGPMMVTRRFVEATINKPYYKNIVFIGSMAYKAVLNASSFYCASKAGLNHFARCAAWELTPKGYRVFCVNPSNVDDTPMTEATIQGIMKYRGIGRDEAEEYWGAINLFPRWLHPEHIADVVTALVIDESFSYMTGSPIDLPAGQR